MMLETQLLPLTTSKQQIYSDYSGRDDDDLADDEDLDHEELYDDDEDELYEEE
jgi:hypothetical protein